MAGGEKEPKAARAACEEAIEGDDAATKRCEEAETCLKTLQEEQARLAELRRLREEELTAREAKLAAREEQLSQGENRLGAKLARLDEQEKEVASREALLDAKGEALAVADRKKAAELVGFPDVELRLRAALRSFCRDEFDESLASPECGFAELAVELAVVLENAVDQVDKIVDSECRDLFFEAVTRVLSHLHLGKPGFDFSSVILSVPT
ncbi:hypothetical protein D1007_03154 [Hordeum vulgare]|nr:hypothetical protein D1007_03154 [Hordeum vulgare]